ncbi:acyl-CoA thioesterase domain-containing protein [Marmoricola sp. URHB0036]|uniref:acyl-CoA thioesterase domain-containing protein n=1 Tax=Marmoricola sp. URHB0036 TaxID=1298863 RepID=UPI00041DB6FA|nr:acyl-CoA thioesterase domain-containing protein [Marmoricola sp. URHB0036]
MELSFFTRGEGDVLVPTELACSLWSDDQVHGVALSGALARSLERAVTETGRADLRPARYTVDLFRAARMQPCELRTVVVREGRRLCLVDAVIEQGGEPVARASGLFLKPSEPAPGAVWEPEIVFDPPPLELAPVSDEPRVPLFSSERIGWSTSFGEHQNGDRKMTWQTGMPVIPDEKPSPFVAAASIADAASMVTNWGSNGVEQINTDITLTLARTPVSLEIGLAATDRISSEGIAVGTATVFDRQGRLGSVVVSSIANAQRTVDFGVHDFSDDPRASGA